ncbi:hypothetical protein FOPE_07726 [Fonsecaea pedrosoi]|nr:hypothetical protein FOPE_07726 [Fonsecaea pedrosoi]
MSSENLAGTGTSYPSVELKSSKDWQGPAGGPYPPSSSKLKSHQTTGGSSFKSGISGFKGTSLFSERVWLGNGCTRHMCDDRYS